MHALKIVRFDRYTLVTAAYTAAVLQHVSADVQRLRLSAFVCKTSFSHYLNGTTQQSLGTHWTTKHKTCITSTEAASQLIKTQQSNH